MILEFIQDEFRFRDWRPLWSRRYTTRLLRNPKQRTPRIAPWKAWCVNDRMKRRAEGQNPKGCGMSLWTKHDRDEHARNGK